MSRSEKAVVTVLCMVYDGNKILLQDRVKKDWKGVTLPGGHVEHEEPFTTAVIREIYEETCLLYTSILVPATLLVLSSLQISALPLSSILI